MLLKWKSIPLGVDKTRFGEDLPSVSRHLVTMDLHIGTSLEQAADPTPPDHRARAIYGPSQRLDGDFLAIFDERKGCCT